jgi:hypothetical protein
MPYQLSISPEKAAELLLAEIPKRSQTILEKRFGLGKGGKRLTLDAIGKNYNITRERVRQIEADAISRLRKSDSYKKLEPLFKAFEDYIHDKGGVVAETVLFNDFSGEKNSVNYLYFLLTIAYQFSRVSETEEFATRWYTDKSIYEGVEKALNATVAEIKKQDHVFTRDEVLDMLAHNVRQILGTMPNKEALYSYLDTSRRISSNNFDQWGSSDSSLINPRGVRDMAYLIFKKHQKPLHFLETAKLIADQITKRPVHAQTVHNELIKDNRFILIGRGMYGLAEWGYEPGIVRDVIAQVLKSDGPMTKEEITKQVLSKRQVKENTILINLQNKNFFKKLPDGRYTTLV